ncbi:MAG: phosphatase PAP2 family protein [Acidimicrobiales bacterium]|nr:phosphatase PAP2 family protein [Acidimicrobiales bacterium]
MTEPSSIPSRIDELDKQVDEWWERWRGVPAVDRLFFCASNLGDFSLIWHIVGGLRALPPGRNPGTAVRFSALMGFESLLINQGVKRFFLRSRPGSADDNATNHQLREPITSSFPSGHASAAFCASAVLARRSKLGSLWHLVAGVVACSRIHVRLHHASDVTAGACMGFLLGKVIGKLVPKD